MKNVLAENYSLLRVRVLLVLLFSVFWLQVGAQNPNITDTLSDKIIERVLKDNHDLSDKRKSFNGYPYAFYTPESQFAVGAGGIFISYLGTSAELKPSKLGFGGYYSTNKQYKISLSPELYLLRNKLYISAPMSYGFFINKFWGIGDDAPNNDNADYSQKTFAVMIGVQIPPWLFSADRTGIILDYNHTDIVDKKGNELLLSDSINGNSGGQIFGIGSDLVWDSRDNIFFPNNGAYQYFKLVFYPDVDGYLFSLLELDVKGFVAVAPDHVFAMNFYVQSTTGDAPFYYLPSLGGPKRMRGYFSGRYRDNFYGMMQLEYRQYIWKRLGFVAFGGVGNVSNSMIEYNFNTMKYSGGVGLRYLFNKKQKVNLRMDIGLGSGGNHGIYFGIQEAF
ncbi:BamA/TamA family outer membrane protein [Carboxylicivirga sp. M1479]|uniref:BamA/TamA family outer membrane protein n=1 Tax=Carboxylicivirga sp. M1479 TaxID=2594476 RepID=UPI001178C107|nr:BamA/TamA family outer membrane protein [Carboxylicivirga sp. M1479]TRX70644.1 BamA/TamA family outer membrane protein [Carboxylicivirga sp. M1479]